MFNSTNGILAVMKGTATRPRLGQRVFWFVCAVVCLLACSAAVSASERVTYLHTDNLGSVIAGTDEAGNLLWREQYEPYGLKRLLPANAEGQRLWYTGHAHDDAMALSYFGARWYDPDAGRFLAVDPVDWVEERPMHSFNRYAYANNNPYKFVDPDGQIAVPVFVVGIWFISDVVLPAFQDAPNGSVQSAGTPLDLGAAAGLLRSAGKIVSGVSRSAEKSAGSLKNASGSLDDAARKARGLPQGDKFRRSPRNLQDQLTMKEARAGAGEPVPGMGPLKDPRWKGWQKWQHQHRGPDGSLTNIHFNYNPKTKQRADFKFKDN